MCRACELPAVPDAWEGGAAAAARRRAVLHRVLGAWGLTVAEGPAGSVLLGAPDGRRRLARNAAEVWAAAEALSGAAFDPLDPRLAGPA